MSSQPSDTSRPPGPLTRLGEWIFTMLSEFGSWVQFAGATLGWMAARPPRRSHLVPNFFTIGVRSLPVVAVTGLFIGMVLSVQSFNSFKEMGLETRLGSVVNISLVKELGPVLAATMLAGRVGSAMAAELGTMRVTEQIDALHALGVNPIAYLVVPRFLACVVLIPALTLVADFAGALGGSFVSVNMLGVDGYYYWEHSQSFVGALDVIAGLFKSVFFGGTIALIACHRGFHSRGGAEGVGQAATEAFVYSFIAILFLDFWLGLGWNKIYYAIWPGNAGIV